MPALQLPIRGCARIAAAVLRLAAGAAAAGQSFSPAESLLFAEAHLRNAAPRGDLQYRFTRGGSLGPAIDGAVTVRLAPAAAEDVRDVHVDFLSGPDAFVLPDIEAARGNPVILSFLERDVREMQRLAGGQAAYFRKRLRLALAEAAQVRDVDIEHDGARVAAHEISIRPFDDDPLRGRFAAYADKRYVFVLCEAIPGMVYEMRATIADLERLRKK